MKPEEIKADAKKIMDDFMESMKDIEVEEDYNFVSDKCMRDEGDGEKPDEDFRQRFLSNAKRVSGNAVVANRGEWNS